jgi:glycosyl transferase family 2
MRFMPYATIIIPTFDRSETLPLAVESAQGQTVTDIEIVIVGDGASAASVEAARGLAGRDARIVVHEWPKAPGRGYANRHRAVLAARSERIFYLDDDDLMLPNHVETLGRALGSADIVDSCTASVAMNSEVQIALVNHAADPFRARLEVQGYKATFDTHLGHSRAAYLKAGGAWEHPKGDGVRTLLSALAQERSLSWSTVPVATALSFHGGSRWHMSGRERRAELEAWLAQLSRLSAPQIFAAAYLDWYLYQGLLHIPPEADDTLSAYLGRLGVAIADEPPCTSDGAAIEYALEPAQRSALEQVFDLARGRATNEQGLGALVLRLIYPLRSKPAVGKLVRSLCASLGDERAMRLGQNLKPRDALEAELRDLLEASLHLALKRPEMAQALLHELCSRPLHYAAQVRLLCSKVEMALGNFAAAADQALEAQRLNPNLGRANVALAEALVAGDQLDEAKAIQDRFQAATGSKTKQKLKDMMDKRARKGSRKDGKAPA